MKNEYSSIYHLIYISNILEKYLKTFKRIIRYDKEDQDVIYLAIFSHSIILTNCFLDEYEKHFFSPNNECNDYINNVKRVVRPAIKRLKKWKDLKNFRNNVLAHNLRIENENKISVFINGKIHKYNIPKTALDLQIMIECVLMTASVIKIRFNNEFELFQSNIQSVDTSINISSDEISAVEREILGVYEQIKTGISSGYLGCIDLN